MFGDEEGSGLRETDAVEDWRDAAARSVECGRESVRSWVRRLEREQDRGQRLPWDEASYEDLL